MDNSASTIYPLIKITLTPEQLALQTANELAEQQQLQETALQNFFGEFHKHDDKGEIIAITADKWSAVSSERTGLMWATNLDSGDNFPIKTGLTWYFQEDEYSLENQPNVNNGNNIQGWLNHVNEKGWCGFHDWRIPSIHELRTLNIKDNGEFAWEKYRQLFGSFGGAVCWSSSYHSYFARQAWGCYFLYGYEDGFFSKSTKGYIRPVRGKVMES